MKKLIILLLIVSYRTEACSPPEVFQCTVDSRQDFYVLQSVTDPQKFLTKERSRLVLDIEMDQPIYVIKERDESNVQRGAVGVHPEKVPGHEQYEFWYRYSQGKLCPYKLRENAFIKLFVGNWDCSIHKTTCGDDPPEKSLTLLTEEWINTHIIKITSGNPDDKSKPITAILNLLYKDKIYPIEFTATREKNPYYQEEVCEYYDSVRKKFVWNRKAKSLKGNSHNVSR